MYNNHTNQPTPDTYQDRIVDLITSYDPVSCISPYSPVIIDELDQQHIIPYRR
jgi:hypothetical protein